MQNNTLATIAVLGIALASISQAKDELVYQTLEEPKATYNTYPSEEVEYFNLNAPDRKEVYISDLQSSVKEGHAFIGTIL